MAFFKDIKSTPGIIALDRNKLRQGQRSTVTQSGLQETEHYRDAAFIRILTILICLYVCCDHIILIETHLSVLAL